MSTKTDPANQYPEAVIEREEGQFRLRHSDPNDHIWKTVNETGEFYEAEFLERLGKNLKPGDLVLDVGANIGNHSIYFAGVCDARVFAFEPNPEALTLLKENIAANGLRKRIEVKDYALGATSGRADFDLSAAEGNLGAVKLTLADEGAATVLRLDDVKLPRAPRLLKIDAEGMDFDILRGAENLLKEHQPIVAVEAGDRKYYNDVADFLEELGYIHRESLNYTPTHIFMPIGKGKTSQFNRHLAREIGGAYVDMAVARASADQRISRVNGRITSIETSNAEAAADIAASSREMAAALAADVQRVEAGIAALNTVLNTSADDSGKRIQTLDGSLSEVKITVAGIVAKLDTQFADAQLGLAQHKNSLEIVAAQIVAQSGATNVDLSELKNSVKQLDDNIGTRFQSVTDEYRVGQDSIQRIGIRVRELQSALARLTDNIGLVTQSVEVRFHETGTAIKAHADTSHLIKDKVSELNAGLAQFSASLAEVVPEVDKRFRETTEELKKAAEANRLISSSIHGLEAGMLNLAGNVSYVAARLDQTRNEMAVGLDRAAGQNEVLAGAVGALDGAMRGLAGDVSGVAVRLDQTHKEMAAGLDRAAGQNEALAGAVGNLDASIQGVAGNVSDVAVRLDQTRGEMAAGLGRAAGQSEVLAAVIEALDTSVADRLTAIDDMIVAGLASVEPLSLDLQTRLDEVSKNYQAGNEIVESLDRRSRELQSTVDLLGDRLFQASHHAASVQQEAISLITDGRDVFQAGLGELRHVVSESIAISRSNAVRSEQTSKDQFDNLSRQLADATREIQARVDAATAAFATSRSQLLQRLDGLDGRLEIRMTAMEIAAANASADLRNRISAAAADHAVELNERLRSAEAFAAGRASELAVRLSAIENAQGEGHDLARRMEGDILAGMEISSRMGLWVERKVEDTQAATARQIAESIEQTRQSFAAELRATAAKQLESVGKAVADIMLELDRRQPSLVPPASPPRRRIDFDNPQGRAGGLPLARPQVALLQPRARVVDTEAAPLPVQRFVTEVAKRPAPPSAFEACGVKLDAIAGERLANIDLARSWNNLGWAQSGSSLLDGGLVRYSSGAHWPGFVTAKYSAKSGGVVRVTVDVADCPPGLDLIARIRNDRDEQCGPDVPLKQGSNTFRIFAPERTESLKAYVLVRPPTNGGAFTIKSIAMDRLSIDEHQHAVRVAVGQPVLASMASIPSRRRMLLDCVNSLLAQCDRVRVFLNNYPDVPDFLNHPRVDVRRSQDWDDRGDAGKVFWIDRDKEAGYRLVTDDDLLFPPDFSETMCGKVRSYDNRAIFCTHGVLLRQPVRQYYDADSRAATFHFARQLDADATVHIGATNAMCFHSGAVQMKWADFSYCNSADIWISLYAQRNKLPIFAASRLQGWVRENTHDAPDDTIYNHSRKRTKSRMDSSLVQDAALRRASPLTLQPTHRPKLGLVVVVDDAATLKAFVEGWTAAGSSEIDWVVSLIPATAPQAFREAICDVVIEHETHLFDADAPLEDRIQAARRLSADLGVEATLFVTEKMRFPKAGWEGGVFSPTGRSEALLMLREAPGGGMMLAPVNSRDGHLAKAFIERTVGDLGLPRAADLGSTLKLEGQHAPAMAAVMDGCAFAVPTVQAPVVFRNGRKPIGGRINDMFERVVVLNLDRRPDRWAQAQRQLEQAGVNAERFSAVDGSAPEVDAEYQEYTALPLIAAPPGQRPLKYSEDFYIHAESQASRIAHLERNGRKAVASRGAWGYLKSYRTILEQAMKDQVESLLVFDDDVLMHRRTQELFAAVSRQLPEDWLMLQLGTLQYNWKAPWCEPVSENLYRTRGSAIGSHAVGVRFDMMPYLLDHAGRMDMPFDVGALSAATQAFSDRSFITLPNIAIQRLGAGSDINTSDFQKQTNVEEIAKTYRWNLADYFQDA